MNQPHIPRTYRAVAHERVEIDYLPPVLGAEHDDRHRLAHLLSLHQRQQLEQLVERTEPARKHDHRLRKIGEPEFAHEEVVEVKRELARNVVVAELVGRNRDGQADVDAARLGRAPVGRFHDAGAAAGAHHEAPLLRVELLGPVREAESELARGFVVGRHAQRHARVLDCAAAGRGLAQRFLGLLARLDPRRAHEHDGIIDALALEPPFGLEIFRQDAQGACVPAVQKRLVTVSFHGLTLAVRHGESFGNVKHGKGSCVPVFCPTSPRRIR